MTSAATLCDDLEKLLKSGYAELIRTGMALNENNDGDQDFVEMLDSDKNEETPFPKGKTVFDDDDDEDESPRSLEDEFEDGYEVICVREIDQIPVF